MTTDNIIKLRLMRDSQCSPIFLCGIINITNDKTSEESSVNMKDFNIKSTRKHLNLIYEKKECLIKKDEK